MNYPADLRLDADAGIANWRPLVHWLLAIPHLAVASALQQVGQVVAVISWFIIVFTGSLPVGLRLIWAIPATVFAALLAIAAVVMPISATSTTVTGQVGDPPDRK